MRAFALVAGFLSACPACGALGPRDVDGPAGGPKGPLDELRAPGAARIVAVERAGRGSRLVLVDEGGRRVRSLTGDGDDETVLDVSPAWSPDGRWIVFASTRGRGHLDRFSLWAVSPQGGGAPPHRLTGVGLEEDAEDAGHATDLSPSWMPGSNALVFVSRRDGGRFDLWRADVGVLGNTLAASAPRRLVARDGEQFEAAVSPEGGRVAFTTIAADGARSLGVLDVKRGRVIELGAGESPTWSPDGDTVFFSATGARASDKDIFRVRADGRGRAVVVDTPLGDEVFPSVSSDGRWLLCTSMLRSASGVGLAATLVVTDLGGKDKAGYRALVERRPAARIGGDLAPVPLASEVLAGAPTLAKALEDVLHRAAVEQDSAADAEPEDVEGPSDPP